MRILFFAIEIEEDSFNLGLLDLPNDSEYVSKLDYKIAIFGNWLGLTKICNFREFQELIYDSDFLVGFNIDFILKFLALKGYELPLKSRIYDLFQQINNYPQCGISEFYKYNFGDNLSIAESQLNPLEYKCIQIRDIYFEYLSGKLIDPYSEELLVPTKFY